MSDVELGRPRVAGAFALVCLITEGVAFLVREVLGGGAAGPFEVRKLPDGNRVAGFGVVLELPDGSFNLLFDRFEGVLATDLAVEEASEIGGDGGVGVSETVSAVEIDFVSGGVVIIGDDAVDAGEVASKVGVVGEGTSVDIEGSWRFRSLSCMIPASTFRSESSSLRR